jgi:hypothetical protein
MRFIDASVPAAFSERDASFGAGRTDAVKDSDRSAESLRFDGFDGFDDFAGFEATRADAQPFGAAVDFSPHRVQVHVPPPSRNVVRVGDVVTELRPFAANIANLCHDVTPRVSRFSPRAKFRGVLPGGGTRSERKD